MAELIGHINVKVGKAGAYTFEVDGQEFPWHIAADGITQTISGDEFPAITFTLIAERVTTEHDWSTD